LIEDIVRRMEMLVSLQRVKGSTFIGKGASNHWVVTDSVKKFGGSEAASRPMELLLISLASCTAMDVESLLNKMRSPVTDFRIEVEGARAEEHPKVFTKIHLKYLFWGDNLNKMILSKAVEMSQEKYCSVTAMLRKSADITHEILINPDEY
jgi:putative redox protein